MHASDVRHEASHQSQRVARRIDAVLVPRGASKEQVGVRLPLSQRGVVRTAIIIGVSSSPNAVLVGPLFRYRYVLMNGDARPQHGTEQMHSSDFAIIYSTTNIGLVDIINIDKSSAERRIHH